MGILEACMDYVKRQRGCARKDQEVREVQELQEEMRNQCILKLPNSKTTTKCMASTVDVSRGCRRGDGSEVRGEISMGSMATIKISLFIFPSSFDPNRFKFKLLIFVIPLLSAFAWVWQDIRL